MTFQKLYSELSLIKLPVQPDFIAVAFNLHLNVSLQFLPVKS